MNINIKWSDDGSTGTITKEEFQKLEETIKGSSEKLTEQFNAGFAKGTEKGRREVLSKFDFLELDANNLDASIAPMKQTMQELKQGKVPEAIMAKLKDTDIVQDLQKKLQASHQKLDEIQRNHQAFVRDTLIKNQLVALAGREKTEAINREEVVTLFTNTFKVDVDEQNNLRVTHPTGAPVFNGEGKELGLEDVFNQFASARSHLFKGNEQGGSGGTGPKLPANVTYADLKTDAAKVDFIAKHGSEAYAKLVDTHMQK